MLSFKQPDMEFLAIFTCMSFNAYELITSNQSNPKLVVVLLNSGHEVLLSGPGRREHSAEDTRSAVRPAGGQ